MIEPGKEWSKVGFRRSRIGGEQESHDEQHKQSAHFCHGENILNDRTFPQSTAVHPCQNGEYDDGRQVLARQVVAEGQWHENSGCGNPGHKQSGKFGEGDDHSRDRSRLDDKKQGPAVQETEHRPEGFAKKNILAARVRHGRSQFAIAQRRKNGHDGRDEPGDEKQSRRSKRAGHIRRNDENAGPDHAADDDCGGIKELQTTHQLSASA